MSDLATTLPLYSSRPRIKIDGQQDARIDSGLLNLSVMEDEFGLYRCELTFGNWGSYHNSLDYLYFDREVFDFGKQIDIEIGDGAAAAPLFSGRISGMEGRFVEQRPPEILILAEDKLQDLRMVRRTRTFEDASLDGVLDTIVSEHGLQLQIDIDSPQYKTLSQVNQSDLAFIRERARLIDAEVWVEGDALYVQARSRRKVASLELTYKQRLHEFSVLADIAHQRSMLSVSGWDIGAKDKLEYSAGQDCIQSEIGNGLGGAQVLNDAFGNRHENVAHLTPMSDDETQNLAESYYRTMARRFVTGRGLAEGDARLKAGAHVTIDGVGSLFNGLYFVNSVHHMFCQDDGFRTQFCVQRPFIGTGA